MSRARLDPELIAEFTRASRAAAGLPTTVADPEVLRRVAALLCGAESRPVLVERVSA